MRLVGSQHDGRVQVSCVVISVIQRKIALRVKDGGLVEIGIEACPNERAEALEKVGQVGWRRFGLMGLHAFEGVRETRSDLRAIKKPQDLSSLNAEMVEKGAADRRTGPGVVESREVCSGVRLNQPV